MSDSFPIAEPFKIKVIEPLVSLTREERIAHLTAAGFNLFGLPSRYVTFDFLTDSGTTAMSAAQWAAMMQADESYAGSRSFEKFASAVQHVTGYPHVIPTHQGRAAERLLFQVLVKRGSIVPSNNHFDTTRANIEQLGGEALDLVIPQGKDPASQHPFKGNIDLEKLAQVCRAEHARIPLGMLTITNNSGGGQPVSLENIEQAAAIYRTHGIPFILDACRFAENSYFVKLRESRCNTWSPKQIAQKTFAVADGCVLSAKKDGMVNIGGFIALRHDTWTEELRSLLILTEGFPTYGGLAARDLEALALGIEEALDERYLEYRIAVSRYMGEGLNALGIPTVQPPGGHAIYIDAREFLPHIPPAQFPGQALACELYLQMGLRSCEIGSAMFGKVDVTGNFVPSALELVRLAFPRRVYTQSHFDYVLNSMRAVVARKDYIRGLHLTYEPKFLRHFTARFAPIGN